MLLWINIIITIITKIIIIIIVIITNVIIIIIIIIIIQIRAYQVSLLISTSELASRVQKCMGPVSFRLWISFGLK